MPLPVPPRGGISAGGRGSGIVMPRPAVSDPSLAAALANQANQNRDAALINQSMRQNATLDLARMRLGMLQDSMRQVNGHSVAARRTMGF